MCHAHCRNLPSDRAVSSSFSMQSRYDWRVAHHGHSTLCPGQSAGCMCLHLDFDPARGGDVTASSRARPPPSFDQSRTAAPATAGLGHVPSHVTTPGPMPGPWSHQGLTSHVSPSPSDPLTQIEYTQNIDANTYPKTVTPTSRSPVYGMVEWQEDFATSAPRNVSLVMIL